MNSEWDQVKRYEEEFKSGDAIAVVWLLDDVICTAEEMGYTLTEEQARDILAEISHRHDATIGINWEVIQSYIDWLNYDLKDRGESLPPATPCPECEELPSQCFCDH